MLTAFLSLELGMKLVLWLFSAQSTLERQTLYFTIQNNSSRLFSSFPFPSSVFSSLALLLAVLCPLLLSPRDFSFTCKNCLVAAEIQKDRETGHTRGYGFVLFGDAKSAADAIAGLDGKVIPCSVVTMESLVLT